MVEVSEILSKIQTRVLKPNFHCYNEVASTNEIIKTLLLKGANEGTIVIAEKQTAGRGRYNRTWWSPYGGLYLSLILNPRGSPEKIPMLGLLSGCAVVEAIGKLVQIDVRMKWPNDIVIGEKKLGGILCELVSDTNNLLGVILGIGINQNNMLEKNPELTSIATSLINEVGYETSREDLVSYIINSIDSRIHDVDSKSSFDSIRNEWLSLNITIGKTVIVSTEHGEIKGKATGITETGSLLISTNGKILDITAGDVFHIR